MKISKNELVKLNIESITNLGYGVAHIEGMVVFVSDAVTGDTVLARIIKTSPSYSVAKVEEYIERSNIRSCDRCQNKQCKSCAYKLVDYAYELEIKHSDVEADFRKNGLYDVCVLPVVPSPATHGYRNKAQYPIARDKSGKYFVGFYAPKSHRVTEAHECPLAPPIFAKLLELLVAFFERHSISVYDEQSGDGLLRHVYMRRAQTDGQILLTVVINGGSLPHSDELVALVTERFPEVVGVLLNVNTDATNVVLGKEFITLWGRDYIVDTLAGVSLCITAPSFYQVNHDCAELLYAKAKELAAPTKDDTLLDIYCGAGSIGLSMAREVKELIGIEIVESAVECARLNAKENGIENAHFFTGDAKYTERMLDNAERELGRKIKPTVVVLDPPRAGCDKELINYVSSLNPTRIVYISCNPATLARDMAVFAPLGYTTNSVTPVDMFPATGHVESVVCLTRRLDNELRERMN